MNLMVLFMYSDPPHCSVYLPYIAKWCKKKTWLEMAHSPPDPVWDIWYTGGSAAQIFPAYRKIKSVWLALHEEEKLHTKLIY